MGTSGAIERLALSSSNALSSGGLSNSGLLPSITNAGIIEALERVSIILFFCFVNQTNTAFLYSNRSKFRSDS